MARFLLVIRGNTYWLQSTKTIIMNLCLKTAIAALLASAIMPVTAGTITVDTTGVSAPNVVENFEGVTTVTSVSDQFARSGLSIQTLNGKGASLVQCNSLDTGVSGNFLYVGVALPCSGNLGKDGVSIKFSNAVSELSWTGFTSFQNGSFTVSALNKGLVVSSSIFDSSNTFRNRTVLLKDSVFDELRIVESTGGLQYMGIDNMAWKTAVVPLPGTLPLLAIGVLGLGAIRRRTHGA